MPRPPGTCRSCGGPTRSTLNQFCMSCYRSRATDAERFLAKVDRSAGPEACWPYTGARMANGYGAFRVDGKVVSASRFALGLARGRARVGSALAALATDLRDERLARDFGIAISHAQRIVTGASWAHTLEGARA